MKTMKWPSASVNSLTTDFNRSSNSPRYFAPANSRPMSSAMISFDLRLSADHRDLSRGFPSSTTSPSPPSRAAARPAPRTFAALARVGLDDAAGPLPAPSPTATSACSRSPWASALGPKLLILDEPTQGLAGAEIDAFKRLVREVAPTAGVLLIEHNMDVVMDLARRITVLDFGRKLATGRRPRSAPTPPSAPPTSVHDPERDRPRRRLRPVRVLRRLSLAVAPGEVLCLMGRNGAGKSTPNPPFFAIVDG